MSNLENRRYRAYERLKELNAEADSATYAWTNSGKSTEWKQSVQSALRHLFGEQCEQLKAFNAVRYSPSVFVTGMSESVFQQRFMGGIRSAQAIIRSAIKEFEDYHLEPSHRTDPTATTSTRDDSATAVRKIFVVHGHDNEMKQTVARFLERLDFEAIILHEKASGGDTIIEKFERNSDVSYAVVLLSPDDVGAASDKRDKLQARARQNVVLELGYFIGKLGRSHVCTIVRGQIEAPSDFHGVVYVPFEGEDWKFHLVKELKHLGFDIDANRAF